jgi:hypothetical protein
MAVIDYPDDPRNRAERISKAYDAAAKGKAAEPKQEQQGSKMVREDQPKPVLKPRGMGEQGPDRESFNARLQKEGDDAKDKRARDIKDAAERRAQMEKDRDKDKER